MAARRLNLETASAEASQNSILGMDPMSMRIFDARELGASMEEIGMDLIKIETQEVLSKWFHSSKDVDLFVWFDKNNQIIKQQMVFLGQVVEWNLVEGVRTGVLIEEESEGEDKKIKGSEVIRFDGTVVFQATEQAAAIIDFMEVGTEELKKQLSSNFVDSPQISKMHPEEFLRRYAPKSRKESSIWFRFLSKIGLLSGTK